MNICTLNVSINPLILRTLTHTSSLFLFSTYKISPAHTTFLFKTKTYKSSSVLAIRADPTTTQEQSTLVKDCPCILGPQM